MTIHAGFAETSIACSPTPDALANAAPTPTVTVVICAYTERRWPEITCAVGSVLRQATPPDQLVLVIDHNDALLARARASFPEASVVPNTGRRGLSDARNTGVASARGEIIVFLDDDARAEADWLTRLIAHYRDPEVLAVGGRAVPAWEAARPAWLPAEFDWVVGCSYTGQPTGVAPVRNLIGCNMSFRRVVLERTNGFDSALGRVGRVPVGCEETELCIRIRRHFPGGVVLYDPAAVVRHRVPTDRATWSYFRHRCFAEGRSKAVVSRLVGTQAGLASEREYTRRTLPRALGRELALRPAGEPGGLQRAGVIVAGLAATAAGYLTARARGVADTTASGASRRSRTGPEPVRVLDVELSEPMPSLPDAGGPQGRRYAAAQVLIRLHGQFLGLLHTELPPGGLTGQALADLVERQLSESIDGHLQQDGHPRTGPLAAEGLAGGHVCVVGPPSSPTPFVSVVVPTGGDDVLLARCLDSLAALDYPAYEILVVDNAPGRSGIADLVVARAAHEPRLRYTAERRRGVAHARNRGLAEARGEIVAFADDDVVVDRRWLRVLVDGFSDREVAGVTGHVLASELETPAQVWLERYGGFGKGCQRRRFDVGGYDVVEHGRVRRVPAASTSLYPYLPGGYGSGANMAFRTETLRRLGGFDTRLGSGAAVRAGEDIDVLMRLVLAGHALVYEPGAAVWHAHRRDVRALRRTIYAYGVGLTAVMAKCLVTDRSGRRRLLRRLPRGVLYALHPGSAKNAGRRRGYPLALTALELTGMALGPVYYVRAAWTARREGTCP